MPLPLLTSHFTHLHLPGKPGSSSFVSWPSLPNLPSKRQFSVRVVSSAYRYRHGPSQHLLFFSTTRLCLAYSSLNNTILTYTGLFISRPMQRRCLQPTGHPGLPYTEPASNPETIGIDNPTPGQTSPELMGFFGISHATHASTPRQTYLTHTLDYPRLPATHAHELPRTSRRPQGCTRPISSRSWPSNRPQSRAFTAPRLSSLLASPTSAPLPCRRCSSPALSPATPAIFPR